MRFPDLVKRLSNDIKWTTDLGNAFLVQQAEVMEAAQRMRKKAKDGGKLESNEQQKVTTTTVENKTVIEVQPANPQVIYVPSYNPTVVYGPPIYPYPPIYYPPYYYSTGAVIATGAISFGMGVAVGAMFSGGWGWGCGWGGNNIVINNNYMSRNNFNNINRNNFNNHQYRQSIELAARRPPSWRSALLRPERRRQVRRSVTPGPWNGPGRERASQNARQQTPA